MSKNLKIENIINNKNIAKIVDLHKNNQQIMKTNT